MFYYLICRFLKNGVENLSEKAYVYEVCLEDWRKVKVGYHYKIKNTDGYDYRGSFIEIVGKVYFLNKQRIRENYSDKQESMFVNEYSSTESDFLIKKLAKIEPAGKLPYADILQDKIVLLSTVSFYRPIKIYGKICSSLREAYSIYKENETKLIDNHNDIFISGVSLECTNTCATNYSTLNSGTLSCNCNYNYNNISNNDYTFKNEIKGEKKSMNKIFGNVEFGKYTGNKITMSVNGLAYLTNDNKYVAYDANKLTLTDVSEFVFDMKGLLYLFPVAIKDIKVGDIIKHGDSYVIVTEIVNNACLEVIDPSSNEVKNIIPLRNIFGFNFYTKVVSLMGNNAFGTINETNPFGNALPLFLMMGDNKTGFDAKTFMLMNMLNEGKMDFQNNPYLMFLFLDNKGDMNDLLPLMMLSNGNFSFGEKTSSCETEKEKENKKS